MLVVILLLLPQERHCTEREPGSLAHLLRLHIYGVDNMRIPSMGYRAALMLCWRTQAGPFPSPFTARRGDAWPAQQQPSISQPHRRCRRSQCTCWQCKQQCRAHNSFAAGSLQQRSWRKRAAPPQRCGRESLLATV